MKIRLEKITELSDAKHPNNKEVGYLKVGTFIAEPKVGKAFCVEEQFRTLFMTSIVKEIVDESTFKTQNSVYKWEIIK